MPSRAIIRFYAKENLKQVREDAMFTQKEVANIVSSYTHSRMARSSYSIIERGDRSISAEEANVIARLLKVDLSTIFTPKETR